MVSFSSIYFIILAAGKGSRMNSTKPKILHEIFHTPMLELLIENINKNNINIINMVISEEGNNIKNLFEENKKINYVTQKEQLGTAHAVKVALDEGTIPENGTLIILYGDTPFITIDTINRLAEKIEQGYFAAVAAFHAKGENQYGRLCVNDNKLEKIIEFKDASAAEKAITLCNSGIMALNLNIARDLIDKIDNNNIKKEYYLTDVIAKLNELAKDSAYIEVSPREVQGVNNKFELANATKYYLMMNRNNALAQGVTLIDPESCYLGHNIKFGKDVVIEPNVTIFAHVEIGDKVTIKAFSYIEDAVIDAEVEIGPYARIRPKSKIASKVKIGNFVEIKNSVIKFSSKINHLSYIGDSEIGAEVNIGAGSITCNYDGFKKHKTIIEDEVFIGSNSALIAPLHIGKGSIIGAGSTITNDIKQNSVIIARSKQNKIADASDFKNKKNT